MAVRIRGLPARQEQQLAGHAQVQRDLPALAQSQEQVLAVPANGGEGAPAQSFAEGPGAGAHHPRKTANNAAHPPPGQEAAQLPGHGLHFGQLRHAFAGNPGWRRRREGSLTGGGENPAHRSRPRTPRR